MSTSVEQRLPALLDVLETPGAAYPLALTYIRLMFISMPLTPGTPSSRRASST